MPESHNCPVALQHAILDVLYQTLLYIRGNSTDATLVHALADHAHNLPSLLSHFHPDLLAYYWEAERPSFLYHFKDSSASDVFFVPKVFQPMWSVIEQEYSRLCKASNESDRTA
jgi:hypothetical protein